MAVNPCCGGLRRALREGDLGGFDRMLTEATNSQHQPRRDMQPRFIEPRHDEALRRDHELSVVLVQYAHGYLNDTPQADADHFVSTLTGIARAAIEHAAANHADHEPF